MRVGALKEAIEALPSNADVLDYGCLGWKLVALRRDLRHHGCDFVASTNQPDDVRFYRVSGVQIPLADDSMDMVVASHVLEHTTEPVALFNELARISKPGGTIYIETPSERWLHHRSHRHVDAHRYTSFWDDPTHVRPWTLAALYRLANIAGFGLRPLKWSHIGRHRDRLLYPLYYALHRIRGGRQMAPLDAPLKTAYGLDCFPHRAKKRRCPRGA